MKLFTKNTIRNLALSALSAAVLSACGGAGSCTSCNTPPSGNLTLSISAPSQYPAGLPTPIEALLTMTNTSNVNASNLVYTIPAPNQVGNYTGVVITPNAGIGSQSGACTNIAAGASCTFTATIAAYANPGSFTVTATPNGSATQQAAKTTQVGKALQADSISVTANLGLVDIPNTNNEYYILPSDQIIQGSSSSATTAYVSVLVKAAGEGLDRLKLVDETGAALSYVTLGTPHYTVNSVNSYAVTIPAGKSIQHIQALSNVCTTLNTGENNNSACSNDADVNLAQSGVGILAIQPNYFQMSESRESQIVTLQNVGTANITSLQLPQIAAPFSVLANTCSGITTLAPLASCTVTIGYTLGTDSGQGSYIVNYNNGKSAVNTSATIPYVGTVPAAYAILTASPTSFSLSESHSFQRITVTNTGTAIATAVVLPTLTAPLIESATNCTSTLASRASCSYDVYIDYSQSVSAGVESVTFAYNNGQSSQTTNVAADWMQKSLQANLSLSSSTTTLNPTYVQQTIVLTNNGNARATNLVLPTLISPVYLVSSTCSAGMTLAPQENCSYTISYIGAISSSSENVTFGYSGGGSPTVPLTINWTSGAPLVYIANNGGAQTAGIYKCNLDDNGDTTYCNHDAGFTGSTRSIAFAVVGGTKYLYATISDQGVSKCSLDQYGAITACDNNSGAALDNATDFSEANYIVFATVNNVQYAYITDTGNYNIYTCTLANNGDFASCSEPLDLSDAAGIAVVNVAGTPYLYLTGDDGNNKKGILRYALNPENGQPTGAAQVVQLSNGDGYAGTGTDYQAGLGMATFNTSMYAYSGVTNYTAPMYAGMDTALDTCSLNASGIATACINSYSTGSQSAQPYSIIFNVAPDFSPYAYFGLSNGEYGFYKCSVNQATGALTNCAKQSIIDGGEPYSSAFTIYEQLA